MRPPLRARSGHNLTVTDAARVAAAGVLLSLAGAQLAPGVARAQDAAQPTSTPDKAHPSPSAATSALPAPGTPQDPVNAPASIAGGGATSDAEPGATEQIRFEADSVAYDSNNENVTATGNVVLRRSDQTVRAQTVTWNRKTGQVVANGGIRLVDEHGNVLYTNHVELTDELKAGAIDDMLLVLREGGRLAARHGVRDNAGGIVLSNAAYTGCPVVDENGCPRKPTWEITAVKVTYDPVDQRVRYHGAMFHIFGIPLLPLPGLAHTIDFRGETGLLIPDIRLSASNGVELNETYYWRLGNNRDLAVTGYVYTKALPMLGVTFRNLDSKGAFQVTGYITQSRVISVSGTPTSQLQLRGYLDANGRYQFDENWSLTGSIRVASDRTFLRRYDISRDDRLRSTLNLERIDDTSYLSIAGWAVETLRTSERQGLIPIAFPQIDYRRRYDTPVIGGKIELELNTLALTRSAGQDTQRAFARAEWDLRTYTSMGQEITFTGLLRGDLYHSAQNSLTTPTIYQGLPGWQARGVATAAIDVKWPLVGPLLGGVQVLTPRIQVVASPNVPNLRIPDEDSRAVDLETSNLFALNRFPGYDRVEGGVRFTYGLDWSLDRPGWRVSSTIGQSYRLTNYQTLIPDGTGLSTRTSDVVGRTDVRFRDFVQFSWRYRLDKSSFALRRNEFDATIGSHKTYFEVGYLNLNRNIDPSYEDLQDRQELRLSARAAFAKYWSVFGSAVVNLTKDPTNPALNGDGFQLLRHRLGFAYTDDCLDISVTWRRDYITTGDAQKGNTILLSFALRNLGVK